MIRIALELDRPCAARLADHRLGDSVELDCGRIEARYAGRLALRLFHIRQRFAVRRAFATVEPRERQGAAEAFEQIAPPPVAPAMRQYREMLAQAGSNV